MLESLLNCLIDESASTLKSIGNDNIIAKIFTKKTELANSILNKLRDTK